MTKEDERELQRKLRILQHAEKIGHVAKVAAILGLSGPAFTDGSAPMSATVKLGWSMPKQFLKIHPTRHRLRLPRRFFICAANTTSDQSVSFGIWHATMELNCPTQRYIGFSNAMA